VASRLPDAVPLSPTVTLPKLKLAGLTDNCPACEAPVPDKGIVRVGFGAFELIVTLPLTLPAVCGAKMTEKLVL
jgi:hypothetical protein